MIVGNGFVWLRRIGLTVLSLIVGVPLYAMAVTAFLPTAELGEPFRWIPRHVSVAAFSDMWSTVPLADYLRNSLVVSLSAMVIAVVISVPAGYALARFRFIGRRGITGILLATQAVSGLLFLLPLVLLVAELKRRTAIDLLGTYTGLVLTCLTFALPFSVGMLANFFSTMPRELEDSAYDLGAGPVRTLVLVVLPNALPGIAAVSVFAFALSWGEVLFASALSDSDTRTLAVGLSGYASDAGVQWNQLMAAAMVAALPVLILFLLVRRHLVAGLAGQPVEGRRPDAAP
ncbi:MAG: transporter [Marmoricola sp.]|nr:transporter [Marmoricola sp.]